MIKSMTGFGRAVLDNDELNVQVEVKTLNSKFLDTSIKLSSLYFDKEIEVKKLIGDKLERGKMSVSINYTTKKADNNQVTVNMPLVSSYFKELKKAAQTLETGEQDIFRMVMMLPDAYLKQTDEDTKEKDWEVIKKVIIEAIDRCDQYRIDEGAVLREKLIDYVDNIVTLLAKVEERDPERLVKIRERLNKQVSDFVNNENFDPNRFEQELIYYIEKLDISEEKVRLTNHLNLFKTTLESDASRGKKLTFISQEIGREINTIGAKANDADIQKLVVNMKDYLEKIKEQLFNII
ncbi:MAG: YicC family protein [Thalassobius sp.]|nr:YicC family protein [Thalassovita sp.]